MDKQFFIDAGRAFIETTPTNKIEASYALRPELVGLEMYQPPIFAIGAADDPYFELCKKPEVVGEYHMSPKEWLPQAKTVVSFFLPFTDAIKKTNAKNWEWPSDEWMHARIEGQKFVVSALNAHLCELVRAQGYKAVAPVLDERFTQYGRPQFTSNWSERHAAFACGLGTFSLSKGLITEKGVAGRFGSFITDAPLPVDVRPYTDYEEYCTHCGLCIHHCPSGAITPEGKSKGDCASFVGKVLNFYEKKRYGCGKCQVDVPCESGIPGR